MIETLTRNWGWVALRGILAILFGVLTLYNPSVTLTVLVLWFGAWALVDGVFMAVSAIANRHGQPRWVALLVGGLLGIAVGLVTFVVPGLTAVALIALIAAWAIVTGVAEIVAAIRVRREITGEWLFIVRGVLAVVFGVILMMAPAAGALAMVLWIGAFAVVSGILLVTLAFRLRSWGRAHAAHPTPRHA